VSRWSAETLRIALAPGEAALLNPRGTRVLTTHERSAASLLPLLDEALSDPAVVEKIPQFELLAEVMPYRQIIPPTTVTSDMVTTMNEAIVAAVTGTKTSQQALDDAATKLKEMLEKAGYPQ